MPLAIKYCDICSKNFYEVDVHHLIMGSNRKLADEDGLTINVCRMCHTKIHESAVSERLSKMLGQAMYERTHTREEFMKRYKYNYLP